MDDETVWYWNSQYQDLKDENGMVSVDSVLQAGRDNGYVPASVEVVNDLKHEIPNGADRIYFLVLMKRFDEEIVQMERSGELLRAFHALDRDRNGTIELWELQRAGVLKFDPEEIFQLIDTDQDGHITYDELKAFVLHETERGGGAGV